MQHRRGAIQQYTPLIALLVALAGSAESARDQGVFQPVQTPEARAAAAAAAASRSVIPVTTTSSRLVYITLPSSTSPEVPPKRTYDLPPVPGPEVTPGVTSPGPEVTPAAGVSPVVPSPLPSGSTVKTRKVTTTTTTTTTTVTTVEPPAAAAAAGGFGCRGRGPCAANQQQQPGGWQRWQQQPQGRWQQPGKGGFGSIMATPTDGHYNDDDDDDDYDNDSGSSSRDGSGGDDNHGRGWKGRRHKRHDDRHDEDDEEHDDDGEEYDESVPPWAMTKPSPAQVPSPAPIIINITPNITNVNINNNNNNGWASRDKIDSTGGNISDVIHDITSNVTSSDRGGRNGVEWNSALPPWMQRRPSPSPSPAAAAAAAAAASPAPEESDLGTDDYIPEYPDQGSDDSDDLDNEDPPWAVNPLESPKPGVIITAANASAASAAAAAAMAAANGTNVTAAQPIRAIIVDGKPVVIATTATPAAAVPPAKPPLLPSASAAAMAAAAANATKHPPLQPAFGFVQVVNTTVLLPKNATFIGQTASQTNITKYNNITQPGNVSLPTMQAAVPAAAPTTPPPPPFVITQPGAKQKILIGCVLPFEGGQAVVGKAVYDALRMALTERAKAILPGVDVNLTCSNTRCIDIPAFMATNEFVKAGAVAIIGDVCSGATVAAAGVSNANKIPIISAASTSPALSQPDFFFRTVPSDRYQGIAAADLVVSRGGKNVGIVYEDTPYGYGLAFAFIAAFTPHGGNVPVVYSFERGQGRPIEAVKQMLAGKNNATFPLDSVFVATNDIGFTAEFLAAADALDLGLQIYGGDSSANPELFLRLKGTPSAVANFTMTAPNPGDPAFAAAFKKFTGDSDRDYSVYASRGYDAMWALLQAYKTAVPPKNGQSIVKALQQLKFQGVSGPVSFDQNGDLVVTDQSYVSAKYDPIYSKIRLGQPINTNNANQKVSGKR